jgi:ADP-dependent phosphofructokinase/glucokinase
MPDTITEIKGMPLDIVHKFEASQIKTTDDLLERTATPAMRNGLAKEVGVSSSELTEWINRADLMRLKGVGRELANLLEEAGVDSTKELKHRNAEHLYERLHALNDEKHITHHAPSLKQVQDWIDEATTFSTM